MAKYAKSDITEEEKKLKKEHEKKLRKSIGTRIKLARSTTNYTQETLAEAVKLTPRYISQLERGLAFGSASTIVSLCNALNVNADFFFTDLVNINSDDVKDMIDYRFLETYSQLNDYNKKVLNCLANDLLKMQ